jgi:hypothetical protein
VVLSLAKKTPLPVTSGKHKIKSFARYIGRNKQLGIKTAFSFPRPERFFLCKKEYIFIKFSIQLCDYAIKKR